MGATTRVTRALFAAVWLQFAPQAAASMPEIKITGLKTGLFVFTDRGASLPTGQRYEYRMPKATADVWLRIVKAAQLPLPVGRQGRDLPADTHQHSTRRNEMELLEIRLPFVADYSAAFQAIEALITPKKRELRLVHHRAQARVTSATRLAEVG